MTVSQAIQSGREMLERAGIPSAELESELLLAHVLRQPRLHLYFDGNRLLGQEEEAMFLDCLDRRQTREPLQHILGSVSFCGLEISVNQHVLVPRPETELLAEMGWTYLQEMVLAGENQPRFIDLGTGSGCIAAALAFFCPTSHGYALDRSTNALEVARKNLDPLQLSDRVELLPSDGFTALARKPGPRAHLLISNPPYIPSLEIDHLQPEVRDFDPRMALDGGSDGLDFYRLIAAEGARHLIPGGTVMMEFGDGQAPAIQHLIEHAGWKLERIQNDLTGRERIVVAKIPS